VRVELVPKKHFEKRAAEKHRDREELSRALASGKVGRAKLQRKNAHFVGMNVRLELKKAKALY